MRFFPLIPTFFAQDFLTAKRDFLRAEDLVVVVVVVGGGGVVGVSKTLTWAIAHGIARKDSY